MIPRLIKMESARRDRSVWKVLRFATMNESLWQFRNDLREIFTDTDESGLSAASLVAEFRFDFSVQMR